MANAHDDKVLDKFCNVVGGWVHMGIYDERLGDLAWDIQTLVCSHCDENDDSLVEEVVEVHNDDIFEEEEGEEDIVEWEEDIEVVGEVHNAHTWGDVHTVLYHI